MRVRRKSQKARAMRGLGRMLRGVDSAWNRKDSRSRWRRGGVDCMPRLWKGKAGFRHGQESGRKTGRMYSLSRDYNKGAAFFVWGLRIWRERGLESLFPRGRGERGGWASMADTLRSLGCAESCPNNQKADVSRPKPNMGSLMWRRPNGEGKGESSS
ncbi:hypothetical protein CK203_080550 [Vitis vinifera]|uniref:Uncharacterized protein n=1 Tax=Vitis vinifera TaxID=29760 RepID=A0A438D9J3_VITVI|nr:hypothetical protein CK203_080550 [Vitis vinifera]